MCSRLPLVTLFNLCNWSGVILHSGRSCEPLAVSKKKKKTIGGGLFDAKRDLSLTAALRQSRFNAPVRIYIDLFDGDSKAPCKVNDAGARGFKEAPRVACS